MKKERGERGRKVEWKDERKELRTGGRKEGIRDLREEGKKQVG